MTSPRADHTSTLLPDGRVLIAGGEAGTDLLKTAEIYDPATGIFTAVAQTMKTARSNHTATCSPMVRSYWTEAKPRIFSIQPRRASQPRRACPLTAELMRLTFCPMAPSLFTGGYVDSIASNLAELYDPADQSFTVLPEGMLIPRANHSATLLLDGTVLIAGGFSGTSPHEEVEIYQPSDRSFALTGRMLYHRSGQRALLLADGQVLVLGGGYA